jgi:hypothetical protein
LENPKERTIFVLVRSKKCFAHAQNPLRYFLAPTDVGGIFLSNVRKMEKDHPTPPPNRGGRPTKAVRRDTKLEFHATAIERLVIQEKAKRAGLRLADYLRQIAMQGKARARPTPEELQLYRDLTGAANNLNQLTKLAHQQNLSVMVPRLLKTLEEVTKTLKNIRDAHQD